MNSMEVMNFTIDTSLVELFEILKEAVTVTSILSYHFSSCNIIFSIDDPATQPPCLLYIVFCAVISTKIFVKNKYNLLT